MWSGVTDLYRAGIRSPWMVRHSITAYRGGAPVGGAIDLRPTGGTITDTTKPGVRRNLDLELPAVPGLYDLLAPTGTTLQVTASVRYTNRQGPDVPMGRFVLDDEKMSDGPGRLSLSAPDRWAQLARARFLQPVASTPGLLVVDQIVALIRGAFGATEPVTITATSTAVMGAQVWDQDRAKAVVDLADGIGAWVFCDRTGVWTIADVPTAGRTADWLIDASPSGVLIDLDREKSRSETYNVVVVESSASDGQKFLPVIVWDDDPNSPTYAGTNPLTAPETAGPFGIVTYYWSTPLPLDGNAARRSALTILSRVTGLASKVSASAVPNPAMDAFDALDVLPKRERYDIPRRIERHLADVVTHPLLPTGQLRIAGRSTRAAAITGGV